MNNQRQMFALKTRPRTHRVSHRCALLLLCLGCVCSPVQAAETDGLSESAKQALRKGAEFFRTEVAVHGTYLWQYSKDLSRREGEGKATPTQGWVQPPGTPSVGMAYLSAYTATKDKYYLEAAQETATGLLQGQLRSGGWTYSIEFDPKLRKKWGYRDGGGDSGRNVTTFDDNTTQAALRFLMRLDSALEFRDPRVQSAIKYALQSLFKAQYPNGAWPQGYEHFPDPAQFSVKPASYPTNWSRTYPGAGQYWLRYTLNDGSMADVITMLFEGVRIYSERPEPELQSLGRKCRMVAEKGGEFLLLAQMPDPQHAWAQQYDFEMHPSWARKFEPPAISAGESQGVLRLLLTLYRETGNPKFLAPIPRALDWFRRSRLPDGRLARFYELRTNRPLYFTKDYQVTYDDADVPTHYAFKVADGTEAIARDYERLRKMTPAELAHRPGGCGVHSFGKKYSGNQAHCRRTRPSRAMGRARANSGQRKQSRRASDSMRNIRP